MLAASLAVVLSCLPGHPKDATVTSSNKKFTLAFTAATGEIALSESGKPARWKRSSPDWSVTFRVGDSGKWVAAISGITCATCSQVTLFDAQGTPTSVDVLKLLDEEERQDLGMSDCGLEWLAGATVRGDSLELEIVQGGNRRPTEPAGPTLKVTLNAVTGAATRGAKLPRPSIAELVAAARKEGKGGGTAFWRLFAKAQLSQSRGDKELCSYLGEQARAAPDPRLREAAMESLGAAQCKAEIAALPSAPRGDDGDLGQLQTLEARDLPRAFEFSMTALRTRTGNTLLRTRAASLLVERSDALRWEAARLAVADPAQEVRDMAVYRLTELPRSQQAFELLLEAARTEPPDQWKAKNGLLSKYLTMPEDPAWRQQFMLAFEKGLLDNWASAYVVAAGILEKRGELPRARLLYQMGASRLDAIRPNTQYVWPGDELWCEAKLRLAQLAADDGNAARAVELANQARGPCRSTCNAPDVNRFAGGRGFQMGYAIADEIIKRAGAAPPPNAQGMSPADAMKMIEETNRLMREQAARRSGKDAGR
jgi:hypothetical protein